MKSSWDLLLNLIGITVILAYLSLMGSSQLQTPGATGKANELLFRLKQSYAKPWGCKCRRGPYTGAPVTGIRHRIALDSPCSHELLWLHSVEKEMTNPTAVSCYWTGGSGDCFSKLQWGKKNYLPPPCIFSESIVFPPLEPRLPFFQSAPLGFYLTIPNILKLDSEFTPWP